MEPQKSKTLAVHIEEPFHLGVLKFGGVCWRFCAPSWACWGAAAGLRIEVGWWSAAI